MAYNLLRLIAKTTILKNYVPRKSTLQLQFRNFYGTPTLKKLISFNLSDIGEGIREVTIKEWFVKVGDTVEQFDNLCEVQSDKASVTITSRYDGKIVKLYHNANEIVLVGNPLVEFDVADENVNEDAETELGANTNEKLKAEVKEQTLLDNKHDVAAACKTKNKRRITFASPAVRGICKEYNVDISKVRPSGENGRVLKEDLLKYLGHVQPDTSLPNEIKLSESRDRVEPLRGIRKAMWKSMTESLKIPHFTYSDEVNMTNLVNFREQLQTVAEENNLTKLTFMPFFTKAASIALTMYPILNSSFNLENETIVYKSAHNISVAVDTPQGLVVPNIKNCHSKSIIDIAKDLNKLVERARANSLTLEDFADGTFSLSNIGNVGGTYMHPCIMAPQVSIGAIGRTKLIPRYNAKNEITKTFIMNVSWSADHRVIDGVTMARFSNAWKKYLENPALFLFN